MVVSFYSKGVDCFYKSAASSGMIFSTIFRSLSIIPLNTKPKGNFTHFLYAKLLKATLYEEFAVNFSLFLITHQL
jgi:hypothetical protein